MTLERRIWVIGNLILILLVALTARIAYWQLVRGAELQPLAVDPVQAAANQSKLRDRSDPLTEQALQFLMAEGQVISLEDLPQPVVQRTTALMENITRGTIYDRNGNVLAYDTVNAEGEHVRVYTQPSMAHVLGYVTGIRTGASGLELAYNRSLLGLDRLDSQVSRLVHQPLIGSDLVLTVDAGLQNQAEEALGGQTGAVVVLDAKSGGVLAMVSMPRFDPGRIFEEGYTASLLASCSSVPGCNAPFLNRATQARYPPGSTWKTVTLMAALDTGQVTPQTVFDFGQQFTDEASGRKYYVYVVDGFPVTDPNHSESRLDLPMAYALSANAAFAKMGDEMAPATFVDYARRLGFVAPGEDTFPMELPFLPAQVANDPQELYTNDVLRATTAIGQGELLVTPLNMAMVVLPVVNEGDMHVPYLVERIHEPTGLNRSGPLRRTVVNNIMKPETAGMVHDIMVNSAQKGYAEAGKVEGLTVGAKTGTAQLGGDLAPHAWYIGFASDGENTIVMAIVVENGGEGSRVAAPIFAQLAPAALQAASHPVVTSIP